jgi:hypothetical protein
MMPDEIRKTLEAALDWYEHKEYAAQVAAARAWLDAQPQQWTPVEDGEYKLYAPSSHAGVHLGGKRLTIRSVNQYVETSLPDDLRLCRLTPTPTDTQEKS